MSRLAMTGLVLAVLWLPTGCGGLTYVDARPDAPAEVGLVWHRVDRVPVAVPTGHPLDSARLVESSAPTIVNVWASYCGPCEDELPLLQAVADRGTVRVIGLSRDASTSAAESALQRAGVTYPNWQDPDARFALSLDGRIPLLAIPSSVFLVGGQAVAVHIGEFHNRRDVLGALKFID